MRDAQELATALRGAPPCAVVLLGSVATSKYGELGPAFGERLVFPPDFVGREDMSRGGLLLRCVDDGQELDYIPLAGSVRHGTRPARFSPKPGILRRAIETLRSHPEDR